MVMSCPKCPFSGAKECLTGFSVFYKEMLGAHFYICQEQFRLLRFFKEAFPRTIKLWIIILLCVEHYFDGTWSPISCVAMIYSTLMKQNIQVNV